MARGKKRGECGRESEAGLTIEYGGESKGANEMIIPLISWLSYLLPTIVLCLPIWILGRKRVKWLRWELISILVLPFLVWFILVILNLKPKSLANVGELAYLGYLTPLGAILR